MAASDLITARRIVFDRLAGRAASVYLFGSQARGDTWRSSDIDIAIDPAEPLPESLLGEISETLEESNILPRVDLLDLSVVPEEFRERILKEGVRWDG